ncbi:hypothetical protein OG559_21285 [Micromonospora sp. NBC_01405]|uniref:hypothetical protein n=1 Tax=Micromonospora sp. NBC_01405 TaxID=2903589 RepID=UPI0032499234
MSRVSSAPATHCATHQAKKERRSWTSPPEMAENRPPFSAEASRVSPTASRGDSTIE